MCFSYVCYVDSAPNITYVRNARNRRFEMSKRKPKPQTTNQLIAIFREVIEGKEKPPVKPAK